MRNTFIGTDIVKAERFASWKKISHKKLQRIFSLQELEECTGPHGLAPEKLAARFAAKEAFYKAFSSFLVHTKKTEQAFSFLVTCPYVCVQKGVWDVPLLHVDWQFFENLVGALPTMDVQVSLSHERENAVAFVLLKVIYDR